MNIWDILILLLLAVVLIRAVLRIRKNRGSCSCGSGSCSGCAGEKNCPACHRASGTGETENHEERR